MLKEARALPRTRSIVAAAVLVYLAAVTVTRLPLMSDGSYYLFRILDDGAPFVVYQRYSVIPLQLPTLLVGRLSGSVDAASYVFSFSYALVPLLATALAWCWHRNHRPALLWSLIGITVSVLPAQVFFVSEAVIAMQLWWPMFLLAVSGRWRERPWSWPLVALLVLGLHPLAIPLLALVAVAVAARPRISAVGVSLTTILFLAIGFRALTLAGYENDGLPSITRALSRGGYLNTAAFGLLALAVAIAVTLSMRPGSAPAWLKLKPVMWACIACSAALFCIAAFYPQFLGQAVGARFALPSSALLLGFVASLHVSSERATDLRPLTVVAGAGLAVYLLYEIIAGVAWQRLITDRVDPLLTAQRTCVDIDKEPSFRNTPLATWSTSSLSVVLQGRSPSHLLLRYAGCDAPRLETPVLFLDAPHGGARDRRNGWFDLTRAGL